MITDHNGLVAWTWDNGTAARFDRTLLIETFDSNRPILVATQSDLAPIAHVNLLYGPGNVNP